MIDNLEVVGSGDYISWTELSDEELGKEVFDWGCRLLADTIPTPDAIGPWTLSELRDSLILLRPYDKFLHDPTIVGMEEKFPLLLKILAKAPEYVTALSPIFTKYPKLLKSYAHHAKDLSSLPEGTGLWRIEVGTDPVKVRHMLKNNAALFSQISHKMESTYGNQWNDNETIMVANVHDLIAVYLRREDKGGEWLLSIMPAPAEVALIQSKSNDEARRAMDFFRYNLLVDKDGILTGDGGSSNRLLEYSYSGYLFDPTRHFARVPSESFIIPYEENLVLELLAGDMPFGSNGLVEAICDLPRINDLIFR